MYRVLRIPPEQSPDFQESFVIVDADRIEEKPYCECYDEHGITIGCENAGCYSPENPEANFKDGDEEEHVMATVYEYWDGSNWQSVILDIEGIEEYADAELLDDDDELAQQILKEFEKAEFGPYKNFYSNAETENFIFSKSQFSVDWGIASVKRKENLK